MNAKQFSINKVKQAINSKLLHLAFMAKANAYNINTTLDSQIENLVLTPMVLTDCNVTTSNTVKISLYDCNITQYNNYDGTISTVIVIPDSVIGNKKVTEGISIGTGVSTATELPTSNLSLSTLAVNTFNSNIPSMGTNNATVPITDLRLMGHNTIITNNDVFRIPNAVVELNISINEDFSDIPPVTYIDFSKMVILAVKSFIYRELSVELEEGSLYYGHSLTKLSSIIDTYEDTFNEYTEYVTIDWSIISKTNDPEFVNDYISLIV